MRISTIQALRNAVRNIPPGEIWTPDVYVDQEPRKRRHAWFWKDRNSSDGKSGFATEEAALRDALRHADIDIDEVLRRARLKDSERDPLNDNDWESPLDQLGVLKKTLIALQKQLAHLKPAVKRPRNRRRAKRV